MTWASSLSLAGIGSIADVVAAATLVLMPARSALATTVTVTSAPAAIVPRSQLAVSVAQVAPAPPSETSVMPAGSVSVSETSRASDGPRFCTRTVKVAFCPCMTGEATVVFVTTRSACWATTTWASSLLLPATGSVVDVLTVALLVSVPVRSAPIRARTSTVRVAAGTSVPKAHVITPALSSQSASPETKLTNARPAGSVSVSALARASEGPLLVTTSVKSTVSPAFWVVGDALFTTARSARVMTFSEPVSVGPEGCSSARTLAEFV